MNRTILALIGCVVVLGCAGCIAFFAAIAGGVWFLVAPVSEAGDNFLIEVKEGDFATAYTMCHSDLKADLASAEDLQGFFAQNAPNITGWNFNSRNLDNNVGSLIGSVELADSSSRRIELYLLKEDGEWKISGINFPG